MIVSQILSEISVDLNDAVTGFEFTRWTVDQLRVYVREILITISLRMKDKFTEVRLVQIEPGANWQELGGCTHILRITAEVNRHGNPIRFLKRNPDFEDNIWGGSILPCKLNPDTYKILGYMTSSKEFNKFKVVPPMPPGLERWVYVECYITPQAHMDDDVPEEFVVLVKQWALYRALSVDSENNPAIIQLAQQHFQAFQTLFEFIAGERELRNAGHIRTAAIPPAD
jgi:hypothetical protein